MKNKLSNKLSLVVLSALISCVYASSTLAGECDVSVEGTANMAFSVKEIAVPKTCKEVSITLKNSGTLAKKIMGHNLVITKTADMKGVVVDGMAAGLDKNYLKPNDKRVIAYTKVLDAGESATIKFKTNNLKPTEAYSFFCSFPGHSTMMKGAFKLI